MLLQERQLKKIQCDFSGPSIDSWSPSVPQYSKNPQWNPALSHWKSSSCSRIYFPLITLYSQIITFKYMCLGPVIFFQLIKWVVREWWSLATLYILLIWSSWGLWRRNSEIGLSLTDMKKTLHDWDSKVGVTLASVTPQWSTIRQLSMYKNNSGRGQGSTWETSATE